MEIVEAANMNTEKEQEHGETGKQEHGKTGKQDGRKKRKLVPRTLRESGTSGSRDHRLLYWKRNGDLKGFSPSHPLL